MPDASLFSDNATFGWDRLAFLNNPIEQWSAAAAKSWGKFDSKPGPLICWEPSDQADVQRVYETFSASGSNHTGGVLIASNTDPAMFQVRHLHTSRAYAHAIQLHIQSSVAFITIQVYAAGQSLAAVNSRLPLRNDTLPGHLRIATSTVGSSRAMPSLHEPSSNRRPAAGSAPRYVVACTLSEASGGSAIDFVSEAR